MSKLGSVVFYSIEDIANELQTHPETIRIYIRQGKLKAAKFGKKYWVTEESLKKYFEYSHDPAVSLPAIKTGPLYPRETTE